jgi:glycosyltransferase involved in cell wall biosynthesis
LNIRKNILNIFKLIAIDWEIVTGWLYHSCLVLAFYKICRPNTKIVWNIRHSLHDIKKEKKSLQIILKLLGKLRFVADGVIFNSHVALEQHKFLISKKAKVAVIPNGFDPGNFKNNPNESLRKTFGIFARFHPMKGHYFFLETFREISEKFPDWTIVLVGEGCTEENTPLVAKINELGLINKVKLLGPSKSMEEVYSLIDILVIPSLWGEAFPNVLGEAMLCGKVCVASDVGDSKMILNSPEFIFSPGDKTALKNILLKVLHMSDVDFSSIGKINRERVIEQYSLESISHQYLQFYKAL